MEKVYLAVVRGVPKETGWTCKLKLAQDSKRIGSMKVDARDGKEAETRFRVLQTRFKSEVRSPKPESSLIEARPLTGRTHQIRVHLAESGHPIVGDELYGRAGEKANLALRAVELAYTDPFTRRRVVITSPTRDFCREYGFEPKQ
jgi:23S rRNA-/tRNA-specific pseudouridylate synthase